MSPPSRILIVEDEMIVQMHLRRTVESLGYEVVGTATNQVDALSVAQGNPPNLALMDIRLAGGDDGVETARLLQERHGCAVVFTTAYSDSETIERTGCVAPVGYLIKPFTVADVHATLSTGLASHRTLSATRAREEALTTVVGQMRDAVLVVDRDLRVQYVSPTVSGLLAVPSLELTGRSLFAVLKCSSTEEADRLRAAAARAFDGGDASLLHDLAVGGLKPPSTLLNIEVETVRPEGDVEALILRLTQHGGAPVLGEPRADAGVRLLVYSHDTLGLGHLRRCLNLIRALTSELKELSVLLVTGSPVAHRYELPERTDYLKLPAVRKVAADTYAARSLTMSDSGIRKLRSNLLLGAVRDYRPDVLLVDHSPTGMNGELRPTLEWLREQGGCRRILGLRDVIDAPETVRAKWERGGVYEVLERDYDDVVVYGSRAFYDTVTEYSLPASVQATFVHHVTGDEPVGWAAIERDPNLIVLAIGGGDGGVETVVLPFLAMMQERQDDLDLRVEIILGPLCADPVVESVRTRAEGLPIDVLTFVPDPREAYRRAGLVLATAGYNTSTELLANADRAILIPRVLHRQEQWIRAQRLAHLGIVGCLHPEEVTSARLFAEVEAQLAEPVGGIARMRAAERIPIDGAQRFARLFASWTQRR